MRSASIAQRLFRRLRGGGLRWLAGAMRNRIFPPRLKAAAAILAAVRDRRGLEIGGPSRIFRAGGMLPVYAAAACLDNVNFTADTAWENRLRDGGDFPFHPGRPAGTQWLREAVALTGIAEGAYDFILSSHCLEHVANPMGALHEWSRVTNPGGHLVLVLPDPSRTFDHRRPLTTLDHLRADFARGTGEDDPTHAAEAIALHDIARDAGVGSATEFAERVRDNARNRCLHHHVFDLALLAAVLPETGWHVLAAERARPLHLVAFARKESS